MKTLLAVAVSTAIAGIANLHAVPADQVVETYNVTPAVAQKVNEAIRAENTFLSQINVIGVKEKKGQKVAVGTGGNRITRRTDTTSKNRKPTNPADLTAVEYELYKTETDVATPDELLENWAHIEANIGQMILNQSRITIAEERVMIGFNGVSAAVESDPATNTMLQDVNIGWLQKLRIENPNNVFSEIRGGAGEVVLGENGAVVSDYANLNQLVAAALKTIPKHLRKKTGKGRLVVMVGDELAEYHQDRIYAQYGEQPSEQEKAQRQLAATTLGGLEMVEPDFFPSRSIVITSYDNLSIYYQSSSWKKQTKYVAEAEEMQDYNKRNEGYVVENVLKMVLVENIVFAIDKPQP